MELLLLLIPAVFLPIGLSIAGIWWLLSDDDTDESWDDDSFDGGM